MKGSLQEIHTAKIAILQYCKYCKFNENVMIIEHSGVLFRSLGMV